MASQEISAVNPETVNEAIEERLTAIVKNSLDEADPNLPVVLTAHASVQGAIYGGERTVMLGSDLVLPGSLVRDPRLDYVALGHIHKSQNLNENAHPPVIYPGSIERVDFGEAADDKFFVIAHRGTWPHGGGMAQVEGYPSLYRSQPAAEKPGGCHGSVAKKPAACLKAGRSHRAFGVGISA